MKEGYYVEPFDTIEQAQNYWGQLVTLIPHWLLRDTRIETGRFYVTNSPDASRLDNVEILEVINDGK